MSRRSLSHVAPLGLLLAAVACDASSPLAGADPAEEDGVFCRAPSAELTFIVGRDGIPALTDPTFVSPDHPDASYLEDEDGVIALLLDGEPLAFPLKILRWHENVNLNRAGAQLAVSYCPLTGTALTFDRSALGGAELGISGLLFRNNVVLYDRVDEPSFFPQMTHSAECGPLAESGRVLPMVASWEIRWDAWKRLHPNTVALSADTGFPRPYDVPPDAEYERIDNADVLVSVPIDPRLPPKERVLGLPLGLDGGSAFPFEELKRSERLAISIVQDGTAGVVFWERDAEAALPFFVEVDGVESSFTVTSDGFVDSSTGSLWRIDGLAVDGPLTGRRLTPMPNAYVAFWFAWADFHQETSIWATYGS